MLLLRPRFLLYSQRMPRLQTLGERWGKEEGEKSLRKWGKMLQSGFHPLRANSFNRRGALLSFTSNSDDGGDWGNLQSILDPTATSKTCVCCKRSLWAQSGPDQPKSFSTCSFWVTCCYVTNYPKTSVVENNRHFITVHDFVGQEFQQGSMGDSSVPLGISCGHLALYSVAQCAGLEDPGQMP